MFTKQNKMADQCGNCRNSFVKTGRNFNRIKIEKILLTKTIQQHFSDLNIPLNSSKFVCTSCYLSLQKFLALKENPNFGLVTVNKTPTLSTQQKRTRTPQQVVNRLSQARAMCQC